MREVTAHCAAGLAVLLFLSCASSRPAESPGAGGADSLAAIVDSAGTAIDDLFIENHAALLMELAPKEREPRVDPRVIEARSLVTAAEELYLRGRTLPALRLLDDAVAILRRGN